MRYTTGVLYYIRKQRRMSQKQVAHLIGHHDATMLSKYERGILAPPLRTAFKLTVLYRAPMPELFRDEFSQAKEELSKKIDSLHLNQSVLF